MDWAIIAQLIIQIGLPATQKLIALWETNAQVTAAQFNDLLALEGQTARDRMLVVLKAQGIDPTSPAGAALIALTPPPA